MPPAPLQACRVGVGKMAGIRKMQKAPENLLSRSKNNLEVIKKQPPHLIECTSITLRRKKSEAIVSRASFAKGRRHHLPRLERAPRDKAAIQPAAAVSRCPDSTFTDTHTKADHGRENPAKEADEGKEDEEEKKKAKAMTEVVVQVPPSSKRRWWHVNKGGFPIPADTWERMWKHVVDVHPNGQDVARAIRGRPCKKVSQCDDHCSYNVLSLSCHRSLFRLFPPYRTQLLHWKAWWLCSDTCRRYSIPQF